jgi:hypothetical protein
MKFVRKYIGIIGIIMFSVYWIGSEAWYAQSKNPHGIETVRDFYEHFGTPSRIHEFHREGAAYYELRGALPPFYVLALPSEPPAYIYDSSGAFVEWCSDPGDSTIYQQRWPYASRIPLDADAFRQRYGL